MMAIGTVVTLFVVLVLPGRELIEYSEPVENLGMCLALVREMATRAEEGPLRGGGIFQAGCSIKSAPKVEH